MSQDQKWDAAKVRPVAEKLADELGPGCERIEIAGSLRRGRKMVGDIELVMVEKFVEKPAGGLFGTPTTGSALAPILARMVADGRLCNKLNGEKMKKYKIATVKRPLFVDLFIAHPDAWGYQLAIRTGPSWFSKKMVTQRYKGGLLGDAYRAFAGGVWKGRPDLTPPGDGTQPPEPFMEHDGVVYERHPVPEEPDFMALLSCGYIEPDKRRYQA